MDDRLKLENALLRVESMARTAVGVADSQLATVALDDLRDALNALDELRDAIRARLKLRAGAGL